MYLILLDVASSGPFRIQCKHDGDSRLRGDLSFIHWQFESYDLLGLGDILWFTFNLGR